MLLFSLVLFAASLLVLIVAAVRGLARIDTILTIQEPGAADSTAPQPLA